MLGCFLLDKDIFCIIIKYIGNSRKSFFYPNVLTTHLITNHATYVRKVQRKSLGSLTISITRLAWLYNSIIVQIDFVYYIIVIWFFFFSLSCILKIIPNCISIFFFPLYFEKSTKLKRWKLFSIWMMLLCVDFFKYNAKKYKYDAITIK